jgi:hypothetical protein
MKSLDKDKWLQAIDDEHKCMLKHGVFKPMRIGSLPSQADRLDLGYEEEVGWDLQRQTCGSWIQADRGTSL